MTKKKPINIPVHLTNEEARLLALDAQALNKRENTTNAKSETLNVIRHLGYIQLDTLSVVARAHHHVLHSRVHDYSEEHLQALMKEKKIFEYWSHAAAYLPMQDYRFSLIRKNEFSEGKKHWFAKDKKMRRHVLDKIKAEGALQARDFQTDKKRGSWFDWKPEKIALEQLFQDGTLMVAGRKGFQKIYDLAERILPSGADTCVPTKEEYAKHLIQSAIRAHGFASLKDITHLKGTLRPVVQKVLMKMLFEKELLNCKVEGVNEEYFISQTTGCTSHIINGTCNILSPFDNLIIRRDRLKKIFGYDFAIECYLPEHKRIFGYFCLPVLYKNEFIARFDPKADRKTRIFYVKSFYLEKKLKNENEFFAAFSSVLKEFATFNGCDEIVVEHIFPRKLKSAFDTLR